MQGILLDRQVAVWRKVLSNGIFQDTQIYSSVRAAIVPVSRFAASVPYAYESTHLIWVPYWMTLRKEDAVHWGIKDTDPENDAPVPWVYTINGRSGFSLGIPQNAYYARELD